MQFQDFIKGELLILIPVLYIIGIAIKKSKIRDNLIPTLLGVVGVSLSALWVFATSEYAGAQDIAIALFTSITQGVLIAGASVYTNQMIKQAQEKE